MQKRVRVRRDRPSALTWAVALAVTMLAVYLVTLSAPAELAEDAVTDVRVTREIDFEGVTVHFASMSRHTDEWEARLAAAESADRGAAGVVYREGDRWHVLGAGYELEADAKRIAQRLGQEEGMEAQTLTLAAPRLSMRITAPEGDCEAIVNADRTLRMQLKHLNTMALQVDRGEITWASARTLARVAASETRQARWALEAVSGGAEQPVCAGLTRLLARLERNIGAVIQGKPEAAALSGRLRACHVDGALRLISFLNSLG